jgi:ELWxxDGT repeat protein
MHTCRNRLGARLIEALERRVMLAAMPVTQSSSPSEFLDLNGIAYFTADDGVNGRNIWRSDGTETGTRIAIERAVYDDESIAWLRSINDALYFVTYTNGASYSLWTSDGTPAGTRRITDHAPTPWYRDQFIKAGDTIWFRGTGMGEERGLYRSDGTDEGTVLVKPYNTIYFLGSIGETVIYIAHDWYPDSTHRGYFYLWASGGAAGQATLLHPNTVTHFTSYQSMRGVTVGNTFYVTRYDGLYKTDGTFNSLQKVLPSHWQGLLGLDENRMLFSTAGTPEFGVQKLWLIDDATGAVRVLREFPEGLSTMVLAGGKAFFLADDGTGQALWTSDGTDTGTHVVKYMSLPSTFELHEVTAAEDLVYFQIEDDGVITQWRSDGTEDGTVPVADLTNLMAWGGDRPLDPVGSSVFLGVTDGYSGIEPWIVDANGLQLVADINATALVPPFVPQLIDDSGDDRRDGVTNDDAPTISVGSDSVARLGVLYIDGAEVARESSGFGSFWFDDLPPLADGSYTVTAAVAGADDVLTAQSEPLNIFIDTVAPTGHAAEFSMDRNRAQVRFQFSEDVLQRFTSFHVWVRNLDTGERRLSYDTKVYDEATNVLKFRLEALPPGRYRAELEYRSAEDLAGNVLTGDISQDFIIRPGRSGTIRSLSGGSPAPVSRKADDGWMLLDVLNEL